MPNARLLSSYVLTSGSNNTIRVTANASTQDLPITAAAEGTTYYMSDEGGADDLVAALAAAIASHTQIGTCVIDIIGVGVNSLVYGEGRLKINCDVDFTLALDANTTIDHRVLGFADSAGNKASTSTILYSDYVHRYGWYPQIDAEYCAPSGKVRSVVEHTRGRYAEGVVYEEYEALDGLEFSHIHDPLVRIDGTADASATDLLLTQGDTNASWERFARDCATDLDREVRLYKDITDAATYLGSYQFPENSALWQDPLARSEMVQRAGGLWRVVSDWWETPS